MTESLHTISDLVIHRLIREAEGPSRVELRDAPNVVTEATASLLERLCRHFAERPGKGYGHFEQDERNFPMPRLVRQHAIEQSMDFATLSREMTTLLQARVDEDKVEDGGFVLIARATVFGADCLWVAVLKETLGTVIDSALEIHDSPHLDMAGLQIAGRIDPDELVELGETYARATGYPIQYQWTLIEGINDSDEELDGIVRLLKGKYALMNMIPYNTIPDLPYRRPAWEKATAIARSLHQRGILTKLRNSAGQDVDGGCGQLRARAIAGETPVRFVR